MPRLRGARAALALALLASAPAVGTPSPSMAAPSPLRLVGEVPATQSTPVLSDPLTRRLLVLNPTSIDFYDPFTLDKAGALSLAPYTHGGHVTGMPIVYAWTPGQSRLYLLVYEAGDIARQSPYLAVIDPSGPHLDSVRRISPLPPGIVAQGMSYYAPKNLVYILGQDPSGLIGTHSVHLAEVDVGRAAATWTTPYALGAVCQKTIGSGRQAAVHRPKGSNKVYFGCGTGNLIFGREPGLPGVAAVDVSDPSSIRTKVSPVSGSYASGESLYDDAANRLLLMSAGTGVPGQAAWVFDEVHEVVVGLVAAGNVNLKGSGVDPVGGRLWVAIDSGVLVSTDRGLKIPQATEVPLPGVIGGTIAAVQFAQRVVINVQSNKDNRVHAYVYEHDFGDYVEPPPGDPDATTVDMPEAPGKTGATFGGDAKAYGARVHQVAGVNGVLQNVLALNQDYWANSGGRAGVNDGDRNAWFSRTIRARLGEAEASASAVNVDGDANTRADYSRDYTKTTPPVDGAPSPSMPDAGQGWPYTAAACVDFGAKPADGDAPGAEVECDAGDSHVEATVSYRNENTLPADTAGAAPLASFGGSNSHTALDRVTALGLVVDTTAEVRDVVLAGVVRIGRITSHAKSAAGGRPGTATASYERTFENVTMPGFSCSTDCDPAEVVDAMNAVLPSTVVAELPGHELVRTPRGAQGAALRDPWEHQQDVTLNNDGETDLETPALRVTYHGDNAVRSRLILEFAATQANSTYSIYPLAGPLDGGFDIGSDLAELFAGSDLGSPLLPGGGVVTDTGGDALEQAGVSRKPGLGRRLAHGLRLLLTGRRALLLNALLWSLLSLPVFLIGRRRYLLRLIRESS